MHPIGYTERGATGDDEGSTCRKSVVGIVVLP